MINTGLAMKIHVDFVNLDSDQKERTSVREKTEMIFSRMRNIIEKISVRVQDNNGPKGGIDKQCTVIVNSKSMEPIVVKTVQSETHKAIRIALSRASNTLVRKWKRRRSAKVLSIQPDGI